MASGAGHGNRALPSGSIRVNRRQRADDARPAAQSVNHIDATRASSLPIATTDRRSAAAAAFDRLVAAARRFRDSSVNARILVSMTIVAGASAVVKLASIGKEIAIAGRFGAGDQIDAFVIAF